MTVSFHISSQWACCLTFKHLASVCCSSCNALQKPSTFPSSTCIDLLWVNLIYALYGGYLLYVPQQSLDVLVVASLSSRRSRSIPPRPNISTIPCTVYDHVKLSESCHDRTLTIWLKLILFQVLAQMKWSIWCKCKTNYLLNIIAKKKHDTWRQILHKLVFKISYRFRNNIKLEKCSTQKVKTIQIQND